MWKGLNWRDDCDTVIIYIQQTRYFKFKLSYLPRIDPINVVRMDTINGFSYMWLYGHSSEALSAK